jgi:hypothetical protein
MKQVTRLLSEFMSVEASLRYSGWHRVQAHAQERPNGGEKGDRRIHSGRTVLLPGSLIRSPVGLSLSPLKICDSSDVRSTEKRYDTRRYVSFLRIARYDCIIFENESFTHKVTAVAIEALHEFRPCFIDKMLLGFMHLVILWAECECFGENYRA